MGEIFSREAIARNADAAAAQWVANPKEPKPQCPYLDGTHAARCWQASFERSLLSHSAPDAEASA